MRLLYLGFKDLPVVSKFDKLGYLFFIEFLN